MRRGEIYYIEKSTRYQTMGSEQYAGRPAIVVSNEANNENSSVIEVVYLTTQPKNDMPTHVAIKSTKRQSIALCEQVTSVCVDRFGKYIGMCSEQEMQMIDIALAISLGIDTENSVIVEASDTQSKDNIVRLEAESDVYKKLYEQILERTVRV